MKSLNVIMLLLILILSIISCEKEKDNSPQDTNFYNLVDRIGKWVNADRGDTLEFVNDTILRRYYSGSNDYLYRIDNNSMYIRSDNSQVETQHDILESNGNKIKLDNMYIGFEETINYGIFNKID